MPTLTPSPRPAPAWERHHLRSAGLRAVLADADRRLAAGARTAELRLTAVPEGYDDLDDLLVQVQGSWLRRLHVRLEQAWELGVASPQRAAAEALAATARDLPGVHALLAAHAEHPALRRLPRAEAQAAALIGAVPDAGRRSA